MHLYRRSKVKTDKFGPLNSKEFTSDSLSDFLEYDLQERLKPAAWGTWKKAMPLLDDLTAMASDFVNGITSPVLVHNDLHLDNVLCKIEDEKLLCKGVNDMEAAGGGVKESDLASAIELQY